MSHAYDDRLLKNLQIHSSIDIGGVLVDGVGDGVYLAAENDKSLNDMNRTSFGILQASRTRITKTEYISCPSCGRTVFDLQEVTARIRLKTQHLKGLKIGIIGLGYVGLQLAIEFFKKLVSVGFDINKNRISQLNQSFDSSNDSMSLDFLICIVLFYFINYINNS